MIIREYRYYSELNPAYSKFAFGKEAGFFSTFMRSHGLCSKCKVLGRTVTVVNYRKEKTV